MSQTVQRYRNKRRRDWRNPFSWFEWAMPQLPTDPAKWLTDHGATIVADYDAALRMRAVSGVVGVHDDRRVSSADGQVFVPGVAGEGILTGNVTDMDGLAAMTVMVEFTVFPPAAAANRYFFTRAADGTATGNAFTLYVDTSAFLDVEIRQAAVRHEPEIVFVAAVVEERLPRLRARDHRALRAR